MSAIRIVIVAIVAGLCVMCAGLLNAGSTISRGTVSSVVTTTTPTISVSAGDLIVFVLGSNKGQDDTSITSDSTGDTWARAASHSCANGTSVQADIEYDVNATTGSHTVTWASAGAGTGRGILLAFHGVLLSGPLDISMSCTTGADTNPLTATITPANEYVLSIAAVAALGTSTPSAPLNGYTLSGGNTSTVVRVPALSLIDIGSGTTTSSGLTLSVSNTWAAAIVSFKPIYVNQPVLGQIEKEYAHLDLWNWNLSNLM